MKNLSILTANYNLAIKKSSRLFAIPFHTFSYEVVKLLFDFGYFSGFYKNGDDVFVEIRYSEGKPVLRGILTVSKSSKRVYTNRKCFHSHTVVISTSSQSLVILTKGNRGKIGGEVLLKLT